MSPGLRCYKAVDPILSNAGKVDPSAVEVVEDCGSCRIDKSVVVTGGGEAFFYSYHVKGCGPEKVAEPEKGPDGDVIHGFWFASRFAVINVCLSFLVQGRSRWSRNMRHLELLFGI